MPYFLRIISKPKWYRKDDPWLKDDIPADPLSDLRTSKNSLSVYEVADDKANVNKIVTALAAKRDHLDKFDYALVDQDALVEIGITINQTPGKTFDNEVNGWHVNIEKITATKLVEIARAIMLEEHNKHRILPKVIRDRINDAIEDGIIDSQLLSLNLKMKLG